MALNHSAHAKNEPACKEKWTTLYIDYKRIRDYIIGMGHNEFFRNMSIIDKVSMNLLRMFNRSIYKMIDTFMKTRPIFQPSHFRDFMDPTDVVYNPLLHEEIKSVTVDGEGSLMCEIDLEQDPIYTMFNVDENMISNLATPHNPIQTHNTRRSYK
jgi:hypothetical protein